MEQCCDPEMMNIRWDEAQVAAAVRDGWCVMALNVFTVQDELRSELMQENCTAMAQFSHLHCQSTKIIFK